MDRIAAEVGHLLNLHQTVRESAQTVYEITERLVDALPDGMRNPVADSYVNFAYDQLLKADRLIGMGRSILNLGTYPSYPPVRGFWSNLEKRSDEQKLRLDHHLRLVCLRDSGELLPRRNAAEAAIDSMLEIYQSRDIMFNGLDKNQRTREFTDSEIRMMEGSIELSLDYVETIAGVVRRSTQIAPR